MSDDDQASEITDISTDAVSDTTDATSTTYDATTATTTDGTTTDLSSSDDEGTQTAQNKADADKSGNTENVSDLDEDDRSSPVPELADIIVEAAGDVKGPELNILFEKATEEQKARILEVLPFNIPLKYTLRVIDNGKYWKRQCMERWPIIQVSKYHNDWKAMFVELTVEEVIANFVPGESDMNQLKESLTTFKDYTHRLEIGQLRKKKEDKLQVDLSSENFDDILDDFLAKPESSAILVDFEAVFQCLSEIKELSLVLTPSSLNTEDFLVSVPDFNSMLRGLKTLQKLEKFKCSNVAFTNRQLDIFCCAFLEHKSLKDLDLSCNFLADCDYIAKLLMSPCPLQTLILRHNRIGDDGAVVIASALSSNKSLKKLDLSLNWIGDRGVEFLAKVVSKNMALEDLDISRNKFGVKGGLAIAGVVLASKNLRSLNVAENNFGEEPGRKLTQALEVNKTILNLDIKFCDISHTDEDSIYKSIIHNRSLVNYKDYATDFRNKAASEYVV